MKVTLIRHGFSIANKEGLLIGQGDVELAPEGIEELKKFREQDFYPKGDIYYCSDLKRCKETLHNLYPEAMNIVYSDQLRELNYGCLDGLSNKIINFDGFYEYWLNGIQVKNEESRTDFGNRIMTAFTNILKECKTNKYESVVIVTHVGPIKHILLTLQNLGKEHYFDIKVKNGKGFLLDVTYENNNIVLNSFVSI